MFVRRKLLLTVAAVGLFMPAERLLLATFVPSISPFATAAARGGDDRSEHGDDRSDRDDDHGGRDDSGGHGGDGTGPRHVLTGNCAGFLDPVFSSGVAFATESGLLAAKLLDRQLRGETIDWAARYEAPIKQGAAVFRTYVETWYSGELQEIFFASDLELSHKQKIVSVLAGYVWDQTNPYVTKHARAVPALAHAIRLRDGDQTSLTRSTR